MRSFQASRLRSACALSTNTSGIRTGRSPATPDCRRRSNGSCLPASTPGAIAWPHPKRLPVGPLMNFGYEGETLLLTTVQVPADLPVGTPVTLNAKASWLECKDVCIPGDAQVKLTLPVKAQAAPSSSAALFKATQARVPESVLTCDGDDRCESDSFGVVTSAGQDARQVRVLSARGRPDRGGRAADFEKRRRPVSDLSDGRKAGRTRLQDIEGRRGCQWRTGVREWMGACRAGAVVRRSGGRRRRRDRRGGWIRLVDVAVGGAGHRAFLAD